MLTRKCHDIFWLKAIVARQKERSCESQGFPLNSYFIGVISRIRWLFVFLSCLLGILHRKAVTTAGACSVAGIVAARGRVRWRQPIVIDLVDVDVARSWRSLRRLQFEPDLDDLRRLNTAGSLATKFGDQKLWIAANTQACEGAEELNTRAMLGLLKGCVTFDLFKTKLLSGIPIRRSELRVTEVGPIVSIGELLICWLTWRGKTSLFVLAVLLGDVGLRSIIISGAC